MDPKTIEEIFKRLDALGSKMLEGREKFGELMVKGAYATATSDLFIGAVYVAVAVYGFAVASKGFQDKFDDVDVNGIAMGTGSILTVVAGMIGVAYLSSAIQIFIAPEWYAIKTLIGK